MQRKKAFHKRAVQRLFELIPAIFTWIVILSPIWGGLLIPEYYAYFIIFFTVFMLYKSISLAIFYIIAYFRIRESENTSWVQKLLFLDDIPSSVKKLEEEIIHIKKISSQEEISQTESPSKSSYGVYFWKRYSQLPKLLQTLLFIIKKKQAVGYLHKEIKELNILKEREILPWKEIKHIVIIPFVQEGYQVLKPPIEQLANQTLSSKEHIILVLATEKRKPQGKEVAEQLKKEYSNKFHTIWITQHEIDHTIDEIVGKGSNMHYAARYVEKKIEELGWKEDRIVVSSMDCDSQFDTRYFAALTYEFAIHQKRYKKMYHAPMSYYANYWQVPFFVRIANTMFTIGSISMSSRPDKYKPVSTYSASYKLLQSIGFWSPDIIPEDYHTFFKALFIHGDDVSVVPIFLRTLGDAAGDQTMGKSAVNQYEQVKRWAWGMSDFTWMLKAFYHSRHKSLYVLYHMLQTFINWALWSTAAFLLFFGANIPPVIDRLFGSGKFGNDVLGLSLGEVSSTILTIGLGFFILVLIFDFTLRPKREGNLIIVVVKQIFEQVLWFLMPVVSILFGSLPGLDAQTRLFFGKYLEYRVTEKRN